MQDFRLPKVKSLRSLFLLCSLLACLRSPTAAGPADANPGREQETIQPSSSNRFVSASVMPLQALTSRDRRFVAVGVDNRKNFDVLRWAEMIGDRLERLVGMDMPFSDRVVRIVVREDSGGGSEMVTTTEEVANGKLTQRLVIHSYMEADQEEAREALIRLLLNGYAIQRAMARDSGGERAPRMGPAQDLGGTPAWLWGGLAQCVIPSLRGKNSGMIMEKWRVGEVPPLAEILNQERLTNEFDRALSGVLVGWLVSFPQKEVCFDSIFNKVAEKKAMALEDLAECMDGCETPADVVERWDAWLLRQNRIVYDPGSVTPLHIRQLKAELLLYPGDSGIPLSGDANERMDFRTLIEKKEEDWIPLVCHNKSVSLQLMAVGRGEAFENVVALYCRFLDALRERRAPKVLEALLAEAEDGLRDLEDLVAENEADGEEQR